MSMTQSFIVKQTLLHNCLCWRAVSEIYQADALDTMANMNQEVPQNEI